MGQVYEDECGEVGFRDDHRTSHKRVDGTSGRQDATIACNHSFCSYLVFAIFCFENTYSQFMWPSVSSTIDPRFTQMCFMVSVDRVHAERSFISKDIFNHYFALV
jgi:hypothetical protein